MFKSVREQIACKCIHYTGFQNKVCKAGQTYDDIDKDNRLPMRAALPCFKPGTFAHTVETQCECPSLKFPDDEYIERELKEIADMEDAAERWFNTSQSLDKNTD